MKYLILVLSLNSFAGSFLPKSRVGENNEGYKIFSKQSKCVAEYNEPCISIRGVEDIEQSKIGPEGYVKRQSEDCIDEDDCQGKFEALVCEKGESIKTETEVYCTWLRPEKIVIDDDKKAIKDAEKEMKAKEKLERKEELKEIRDLLKTINSSDLPSWHKKILKRLIRDMKED